VAAGARRRTRFDAFFTEETAMRIGCKFVIALGIATALGTFVSAEDAAPGYLVEPQAAVCYQDCITHSCRLVPEKRQIKKTVYEVQEVPFCVKKLPPLWSLLCHHGCDDCEVCPDCQCPRYKKVLVKKEIVCKEICTTKCVVEEHVERVPCQPCAPACK
jgi:hypothetical protein